VRGGLRVVGNLSLEVLGRRARMTRAPHFHPRLPTTRRYNFRSIFPGAVQDTAIRDGGEPIVSGTMVGL